MKKIVALLLCLLSLFSLASCGNDLPEGAELPEGMQYAGGAPYGFYLYVPEEWTLTAMDEIVGAFVSTLDLSSVSMTRVQKPDGMDIDAYFKDAMADIPFEDYTLAKDGVSLLLGSVSAKGYEYTYSYKPYEKDAQTYRVMQVIGEYKGELYVFTYTALDELKDAENTYFGAHIEDVNEILESLQFVDKATVSTEAAEYEKDADGYLLVSEKKLAGFNFYMDPAWECTLSGGIVEVTAADGKASINMTEAKDTGVVVSDYWSKRKSDLERYTDGAITVIKENEATVFGNADAALAYEYTYTYRGQSYHTYQVILVHEKIPVFLRKGYVFTFTATEDVYATHMDAVQKMIAKVAL